MGKRILRTVVRYGAGVVAVVLLIWISLLIQRRSGFNLDPTPLIILTLIATAWYAGPGPGLVVAILFEFLLDYGAYAPRNPAPTVVALNRMMLFVSLVLFTSARWKAEIRLRNQRRTLEEALKSEHDARLEAEAANRVKDEFLATVSHELRTPLNAMVGWAALLSRHQADEVTMRRAAQTIERSARAHAHIVEDILDVSRIAAGGLTIATRPMPLGPVIQEALESVRVSAHEKAITLEATLQNDVVVLGDADRLQQIGWNLLSNAIKFTPPGGRIEVELRATDGHAELNVRDSGIGISADFLPYLFERFQQADPSVTRERDGLGLGLAIVRHLVELHGGTVQAVSPGKDKGAVFTVRLPLHAPVG